MIPRNLPGLAAITAENRGISLPADLHDLTEETP